MTYKVHIADLNAIRATAHADLISARLLWNAGMTAQAIWMLQQSAEKYLKILWTQEHDFESYEDWDRKLHAWGHKIPELFEALNEEKKKQIKTPFVTVRLDSLRYKATFGYSEKAFRQGELFIANIRKILGEKTLSQFDEWRKSSMRSKAGYKVEIKVGEAIKQLLSCRLPSTKKERQAYIRKLQLAGFGKSSAIDLANGF